MILPSDPLVILNHEFRPDFVGQSDPIRSDGTGHRIHGPGSNDTIFNYDHQAKTRSQDNSETSEFPAYLTLNPLFYPMTLVENSTVRRKIKFYIQLNS